MLGGRLATGADCNPYLAFAASIAGGVHDTEQGIEPPDPAFGNGYESADLHRHLPCMARQE